MSSLAEHQGVPSSTEPTVLFVLIRTENTEDATGETENATEKTENTGQAASSADDEGNENLKLADKASSIWSRLSAAAPSRSTCIDASLALGAAGLAYYGGQYALGAYRNSSAASSLADEVTMPVPSAVEKLTSYFRSAAPPVIEETILPEPSRLEKLTGYFHTAASATASAEQATSEVADSAVDSAAGGLKSYWNGWGKGKSDV